MSSRISLDTLFYVSERWNVVICLECCHAVWPTEIAGHLKGKQHRVKAKLAEGIQHQAQTIQGLASPDTFQAPCFVDEAIPHLKVWEDGIKCEVESDECNFVCRSESTLKKHFTSTHNITAGCLRGASAKTRRGDAQQFIEDNTRPVCCQRFFIKQKHSAYFEVRTESSETTASRNKQNNMFLNLWQEATNHYNAIRASDEIRHAGVNEVNPWLRRTGWLKYLEGRCFGDLLALIAEPTVDIHDTHDFSTERIVALVWDAVGELAADCEETLQGSGTMLRFEVNKSGEDEDVYKPLEPYQTAESLAKSTKYWQQLVAFFLRTQAFPNASTPSYQFTRAQERAFGELIDAVETLASEHSNTEARETLKSKCLSFCVELLNQKMHNHEYDMALVCGLAVLGVDPNGRQFRGTDTYPPILSGVLKIARYFVIQRAQELARPFLQTFAQYSAAESACTLESNAEPSEQLALRTSVMDWVEFMVKKFMIRGTKSPMQWVLDLRAYGMKVAFNTTSQGFVAWEDSNNTLLFKNLKFTMPEFKGMVVQHCQDTKRTLFEDLFFSGNDVPAVPWSDLCDDPTNNNENWNFLQDARTRLPVSGIDWLFNRINGRPQARQRFLREGSHSGINRAGLEDWLRKVEEFRGKLLVLMHMTGGQPARGSEILSVRHANTTQGGHRNLFIEDGMVVFVTRYHKGYEIQGDVKIIHRYLPREVGELVVWYLWLVLPFVQRLESLAYQQSSVSAHLWPTNAEGRKWTTERMKRELKSITRAHLGQAINVADYRHIAIAINRCWVRQRSIATSNEDWLEEENDISDEQAAHSQHVAGMIYAREIQELSGALASRREQFRAISRDWHRFLGFSSALRAPAASLALRPFESAACDAMAARQQLLRRINLDTELSAMMGRPANLRPEQRAALQAIQRGENFIVVVMATGSGKSILFLLPAFVQAGGLTIVVVPLKALRADMLTRCQAMNIRCSVWSVDRAADGASVVLVTPEKALSPEFGAFVNRMRLTGRLDRIVIDECHVMLPNRSNFRPILQHLGRLGFAQSQMLLLTATLPPTEEETLFRKMGWRCNEVTLLRSSTVRKNLRYSVVDGLAGEDGRKKRLKALVKEVLDEENGKAVVMCASLREIEMIVEAEWFPCEAFHAELGDERRNEVLEELRSGKTRVIVASAAFNMGVDISNIRLVVYWDEPGNMMDYGQGSGRAGRDGLKSSAVIIRGGSRVGDEKVKSYVNPNRKQCRRIDIDSYLDGDNSRERCQEDEEFCDYCERQFNRKGLTVDEQFYGEAGPCLDAGSRRQQEVQNRQRAAPLARLHEAARDHEAWLRKLAKRLDAYKGKCMPCRSKGLQDDHIITQCRDAKSQEANNERLLAQRQIQYPQNLVCFRCGVPREICQRHQGGDGEESAQRGGRGKEKEAVSGVCQYYGVLLGVLFGIKYGWPRVWRKWEEKLESEGKNVKNWREFVQVLGTESENGSSGLVSAFMSLTNAIEKKRDGDGDQENWSSFDKTGSLDLPLHQLLQPRVASAAQSQLTESPTLTQQNITSSDDSSDDSDEDYESENGKTSSESENDSDETDD